MRMPARTQRGFTLVEAVTVIVITGILAAMVAVFITRPVQGYMDSARRAWLTDAADTALRRIARDVQSALPNSLRPNGSGQNVELLLAATGGRYSQDLADAAGCFAAGCTSLTSLGSVIGANGSQANRRLVIYSLYNNDAGGCGPTNPSAWCNNNTALITGSTEGGNTDSFAFAGTAFRPATGSPSRRFFIVSGPVAYTCAGAGVAGGNGTGTLSRYENYPIVQNAAFPPAGGTARELAHRVSACQFSYQTGVSERQGLLTLYLELMEAGERVGLYHEVHVDNAP